MKRCQVASHILTQVLFFLLNSAWVLLKKHLKAFLASSSQSLLYTEWVIYILPVCASPVMQSSLQWKSSTHESDSCAAGCFFLCSFPQFAKVSRSAIFNLTWPPAASHTPVTLLCGVLLFPDNAHGHLHECHCNKWSRTRWVDIRGGVW